MTERVGTSSELKSLYYLWI